MSTAINREQLAANLERVRQRIADACARAGRPAEAVRLVAVTKSVGVETCHALQALGVTDMGENRVDVAAAKVAGLGRGVKWHMIGNIQRRKAREVVELFDAVDAIDRLEVAEALQRRLEGTEKRLSVLLEVNVSGEESKHGFTLAEVAEAIRGMANFERLNLEGLMTMAPYEASEAEIRGYFRRLKTLAIEYGLPECSMGMTNDYEIAIEEGATQVRVGSALFEV